MRPLEAQRLSEAFGRHAGALVLYARNWLDDAEAQDAVQDVFLRLSDGRPPPDDLQAWLFRAVRNSAISRIRHHARRTRREREVTNQAPWFEPDLGAPIDGASAQAAMMNLPREQREIIILRLWAGLTLAQVSKVLSEPPSTLFSRYRTGLEAIRRMMEESCQAKKQMNHP